VSGELHDRPCRGPRTTTGYIHDIRDHIIAETGPNGITLREYIRLDDLPVAVADQVTTLPEIYYVHTDHLGPAVSVKSNQSPNSFASATSPAGLVVFLFMA
jgi:hypothetical protein